MTAGRVHYERADAVGRIVFDNPAAYNALTMEMWGELAEICRAVASDRTVKVVTLRGVGGKAFVSGTDIDGFLRFEGGEDGVEYERRMDAYVGALEAVPQPTIAVVEGYAVGGGLSIASICDFRIATTNAKFGSPLARTIGNCLSAKGYARMVAHLGAPLAKRMLLLGELSPAQDLFDRGFLLRLAEPAALDAVVDEVCAQLCANAPLTMAVSKQAITRLIYRDLPDIDDLVAAVYGSADFRIGVRSFLEKTKPAWTNS